MLTSVTRRHGLGGYRHIVHRAVLLNDREFLKLFSPPANGLFIIFEFVISNNNNMTISYYNIINVVCICRHIRCKHTPAVPTIIYTYIHIQLHIIFYMILTMTSWTLSWARIAHTLHNINILNCSRLRYDVFTVFARQKERRRTERKIRESEKMSRKN